MTIEKVEAGDSDICLKLDAMFDFNCMEEFRNSYTDISGKEVGQLNIDFRNTCYMDSSALGMLLNLKKHFEGTSLKIVLINTNEQIKKILMISRFDKKFDIE